MNNSKKEELDFNCVPELCSIEMLYCLLCTLLYSLSVIGQEVRKMLGHTSKSEFCTIKTRKFHILNFIYMGSMHRELNLITAQQDATSVYYIYASSSTCFAC